MSRRARGLSRLAVTPERHELNVSRPHLDGPEHDGKLAVVGMTMSRGARFCSVEDLAPHACIRWTNEVRNHDAWMRIGERSSEAADPFCCAA